MTERDYLYRNTQIHLCGSLSYTKAHFLKDTTVCPELSSYCFCLQQHYSWGQKPLSFMMTEDYPFGEEESLAILWFWGFAFGGVYTKLYTLQAPPKKATSSLGKASGKCLMQFDTKVQSTFPSTDSG